MRFSIIIVICLIVCASISVADCLEENNASINSDVYISCEQGDIDQYFLQDLPETIRTEQGIAYVPEVVNQTVPDEISDNVVDEIVPDVVFSSDYFPLFAFYGFGVIIFLLGFFSILNYYRKKEAIRHYIHTCREQNYSDAQIKTVLQKERGFSESYINKQFDTLDR